MVRFANRVEHLANAIKVINDLIDDMPIEYSSAERVEIAGILRDVNKKLVEKLAKFV